MATRFHDPEAGSMPTPATGNIPFLERCASLGLAALLVASGAFGIVSARATTEALASARVASTLNDDYEAARYDVAAEESLEREYRLSPSPQVRAEHARAGRSLEQALSEAAVLADPAERAEVAAILKTHRRYVASSRAMFAAVDARRPALVVRLDREGIEPIFGSVQSRVLALSVRQQVAMATIVDQLHATQVSVIGMSLALSAVSLLFFIAYFGVMRTYKRQLAESHESEIRQLAAAAMIDHLTGIGNYRAYKDELQREAGRARRHGETVALALLDIDEMKQLNDQHGHLHGDWVLETVGSLLRQLRNTDRPFRIGGDEFAVLLPNTSLPEAQILMARFCDGAEATLLGGTVSIGVAALSGESCDPEVLQGEADAALYAAKRAGRNTIVAFDAEVDRMWPLSPVKVRQLRRLIEQEGVSIVFQPIWDVERCDILAYEALARPAERYGFEGTQGVFDLAERVGRAHEIDMVCLRATLERAKDLPDGALLFVNMTPQSLDRGHLDPKFFAAAVVAAGLTPNRVVIELTERSITHLDVVVEAAKQLQGLGFRLALDDTGAGNAGLEMLSRLPVEFVKIDREIIVHALTDRIARGVIAGIVAIAKETGAYVIAEGIETEEMLNLVCDPGRDEDPHQRGVQGVQGYFLTLPSEYLTSAQDLLNARALLQEIAVRQTSNMERYAMATLAEAPLTGSRAE
jgi:diguanylate cyclase (GGDEF)-like protein